MDTGGEYSGIKQTFFDVKSVIPMKVFLPKLIMAFVICALISVLCYHAAPDVDGRKWLSLIVSALSLFVSLMPALSFDFSECGQKSVSTKLIGYIFFFLLLAMNFIFSCREYDILIYIVTVSLTISLGILLQYSISKL